MTEHQIRILRYLDQHGPTHRGKVVGDLSPPDSNSARHQNGSNGAVPLIMGKWCKSLVAAGLVRARYDAEGFYRHHEITGMGAAFVRGWEEVA